jgi:hypothetical protein
MPEDSDMEAEGFLVGWVRRRVKRGRRRQVECTIAVRLPSMDCV